MPLSAREKLKRRAGRVRSQLAKKSYGRPRLSVFRSSKNISAQIIDDKVGVTIASASTLEKVVKEGGVKGGDVEAAAKIGALLAERAKEKGVSTVIFDRGGYLFHGRVKALADAAREAGLEF